MIWYENEKIVAHRTNVICNFVHCVLMRWCICCPSCSLCRFSEGDSLIGVFVGNNYCANLKHHSQTARIASSKTVFKPFCVRAEHSKYLTALISLAIETPWGYWIGAIRLRRMCERLNRRIHLTTHRSLSFWIVGGSSRRSSFVPTNTIEVDGAWWDISGYH